jgi:TRAP-type transport system small permease protein
MSLKREPMRAIEKFIMYIAGMIFVVLFGTLLVQIFGRYLLTSPYVGTEDLSRTLYIWVTFITVGPLIRSRDHIIIEILIDRLSDYWKRWFGLVADLLVLIFLAFFLVSAVKMTRSSWILPLASFPEITTGHLYLALVIGGILSFFFLIESVIIKFIPKKIDK